MKATALIEQQHREVEDLFSTIEGGKPTQKIIDQLAAALMAHTVMEEQLFYPMAAKEKRQLVLESFEEHDVMAYALKRFVACDPKDEAFPARCKTLKELVMMHVKEEEEQLLPAFASAVPEEEQESLGAQMKDRYDDVISGGYEGALAARRSKRSTNGHRARSTSSSTASPRKKAPAHAGSHHRKAA